MLPKGCPYHVELRAYAPQTDQLVKTGLSLAGIVLLLRKKIKRTKVFFIKASPKTNKKVVFFQIMVSQSQLIDNPSGSPTSSNNLARPLVSGSPYHFLKSV